jgi:hypothetical protein
LISAIARGRRWLDEIVSGSVTDAAQIAARERCSGQGSAWEPFVPGSPLSVLRRFSLCGSSLSLSAILGAWSPHPKIPFLADKALAGGCGFVEMASNNETAQDNSIILAAFIPISPRGESSAGTA